MGSFDHSIVLFLNQAVNRSWSVDTFLVLCGSSPLLRGGPITVLIWWTWFKQDKDTCRRRQMLLYAIVACFFSVFVARTVANALPFRPRPLHNPELTLRIAEGLSRKTLLGWSSFPSDHAAFFFTLATALWFASPSAGAWAMAQVILVVCLPRLLLGIHYPSDILGGAAIGILTAFVGRLQSVRERVTAPALVYLDRSPRVLYTGMFLATYMIGTVFQPFWELGHFGATVTRALCRAVWSDVSGTDWSTQITLALAAGSLIVLAFALRAWNLRRNHGSPGRLSPIITDVAMKHGRMGRSVSWWGRLH